MKLSVVIPCLNSANTLRETLESFRNQKWDGSWEIIVSDNGSTDASREVARQFSREKMLNIRLVDSSDKKSAAHARNVGVEASSADSVSFCDSDDCVADNYIPVMGEALKRHDFVACRFDTITLNEPWQSKSWPNSQDTELIRFYPRFLPFAGGGSIGIKRDIHLAIGGFDENISSRAGMEDVDYCWRIQLAGTELVFVPETSIQYRYPKHFRTMYRQMRNLAEDSVLLQRKYRAYGMKRVPISWKTELRNILKLFPRADDLSGRTERARWVRRLGWQVGKLRAAFRYRDHLNSETTRENSLVKP